MFSDSAGWGWSKGVPKTWRWHLQKLSQVQNSKFCVLSRLLVLVCNAKETYFEALTLKWGQSGLTVRSSCSKPFFSFLFFPTSKKKKKKLVRLESLPWFFFRKRFLPLTLTNERACTWRRGTKGRTYLVAFNRTFEFWDDSYAKFDISNDVYCCNIKHYHTWM